MKLDELVLHEGDRVSAWGRLVRNEQGDWFEPPLLVAMVHVGDRGVRPVWSGAVRVANVDFDDLRDRRASNGAVEGWATLTGIWSGSHLLAGRQIPEGPPPVHVPAWTTQPCLPPVGGWPDVIRHGDANLRFDLGDLRDTGAAVSVTLFRPGGNKAVLVVAAADSAAVEAQLRPQLGDCLCVVPSRWTRADLDQVRACLDDHHEQWNVYLCGESSTDDGQACITASLTRVLPEIAAWAESLPGGLLILKPWLAPLRH
jgi:hypothetical protein